MKALNNFGYRCQLLKTIAPWNHEFTIGKDTWKLQIMPAKGWKNYALMIVVFCSEIVILSLLIGLTIAVMILEEKRKHLRMLNETDALTGIYNRSGFDQKLDQHLIKYSNTYFVVAELDMDMRQEIML